MRYQGFLKLKDVKMFSEELVKLISFIEFSK